MNTGGKVALLVVATLGVAAGTVHLFLPGGLGPVIDRVTAGKPSATTGETASARSKDRPPPPNGADELRVAERAFDAGDFTTAMDGFLAARADANPDYRERAERGLKKAVLAWALTSSQIPPNPLPADPDAEVAKRQAEAEAAPSEQAWYDVVQYAAAVGANRKLPFLAQQALSSALRDGPVEARLKRSLDRAGPRTTLLRDAMTAEGFITPTAPVDPVAEAAKPRDLPKERPPSSFTPGKPAITVPVGRFKPETKTKLEQAVDFEKKGALEYDLSGPDMPKRKEHRKAALSFLKQAREIYQDAQEEDETSPSLGRRLQQVMEMISHLTKEMGIDD